VKINSLTVCLADARRLLAAIEKLGLTPPKTLTDVPLAYERLTATTSIPNPVKQLVAGALDGRATPRR
jgi:hypothetical protein